MQPTTTMTQEEHWRRPNSRAEAARACTPTWQLVLGARPVPLGPPRPPLLVSLVLASIVSASQLTPSRRHSGSGPPSQDAMPAAGYAAEPEAPRRHPAVGGRGSRSKEAAGPFPRAMGRWQGAHYTSMMRVGAASRRRARTKHCALVERPAGRCELSNRCNADPEAQKARTGTAQSALGHCILAWRLPERNRPSRGSECGRTVWRVCRREGEPPAPAVDCWRPTAAAAGSGAAARSCTPRWNTISHNQRWCCIRAWHGRRQAPNSSSQYLGPSRDVQGARSGEPAGRTRSHLRTTWGLI